MLPAGTETGQHLSWTDDLAAAPLLQIVRSTALHVREVHGLSEQPIQFCVHVGEWCVPILAHFMPMVCTFILCKSKFVVYSTSRENRGPEVTWSDGVWPIAYDRHQTKRSLRSSNSKI